MNTNTPSLPLIDAARLQLRPLTVTDAGSLHQAYGDAETMRFWDFPASVDVAQTAKRIEQSLSVSPERHAAWGVVLKQDPPALVGMVNYHRREPWNRRLEVGYILARPYWRQGLMREAMVPFIDYCIEKLDTHRIEATIEPDNIASLCLAERLGFKRESALMRDRLLVAGEFRSLFMYALLAPEWRH
jgi:[ribosomal protein S5]-alanine N-acetyltransferase